MLFRCLDSADMTLMNGGLKIFSIYFNFNFTIFLKILHSLNNQINGMGQIVQDVDDHNRPVNNTLDIIGELVETGADVLSASELNQLQTEGKKLKERYDFVSDNSDKLLKRMSSSKEELAKFKSEIGTFSIWMEKSYKVLEDKERQLANLNKIQGNTDGIKEFVSDVMTHAADLKFLTMSGQKYVQLSKV